MNALHKMHKMHEMKSLLYSAGLDNDDDGADDVDQDDVGQDDDDDGNAPECIK